jgi:hypothetical protein
LQRLLSGVGKRLGRVTNAREEVASDFPSDLFFPIMNRPGFTGGSIC